MSTLRLVAPSAGHEPVDTTLKEFHQVKSVLPETQDVVTVPPNTPVREALAVLEENGFSQVPVVAAGRHVLGLFSHRSFARVVAEMFGEQGVDLGEIHVSEFVDPPEYVRLNEELPRTFDALDRDNAVLVDTERSLIGILTPVDMLRYLYEIANPFVAIAEIELTLREIISECCPGDILDGCVRAAIQGERDKEKSKVMEEMTFGDYVQLVSHGNNWGHFSHVFGGSSDLQRKRARRKLEAMRDLRNDIFHFKRRITGKDRADLQVHRRWLYGKAAQLNAQRPRGGDEHEAE